MKTQTTAKQALLDRPTGSRRENYPCKQALALAVVQLVLGAVCFICHIAAVINGNLFSLYGAGIWGGLLMIMSGGIGIGAARKKTTFLIVATMIISILAALSAVSIIVFSSVDIASRDRYYNDYERDMSVTRKDCLVTKCPYYNSYRNPSTRGPCTSARDTRCDVRVAVNNILILCGVSELVVAILAITLCCTVTCSRPRAPTCCRSRPILNACRRNRTCFFEVHCGTRPPGKETTDEDQYSLKSGQDNSEA